MNANVKANYAKDVVSAAITKKPPVAKGQLQLDECSAIMGKLSLRAEESGGWQLDLKCVYSGALRIGKRYFVMRNMDAVAVAGWDASNFQLRLSEYAFLTPLFFVDNERNPLTLLQCTCEDGIRQKQRLNGLDSELPLSEETIAAELDAYCLHASIVDTLNVQLYPMAQDIADLVDIEQMENDSTKLWAVRTESMSYGIIKQSHGGGLACSTCRKKRCQHLATFEMHRKNFDIDLERPTVPEEKRPVLSQGRIVYGELMLSGFSYPVKGNLIPTTSGSQCQHGIAWGEPRKLKPCTIYDENGRPYRNDCIHIIVANGSCKCHCLFDGSPYGIINVNQKHMIEYGLLIDYLLSYGRNGTPLVAFHDALVESNRQRGLETIPRDILYRGWMGFSELLQIDEQAAFCCSKCGRYPDTILLDGTAISCKKDLIPVMPNVGSTDRRTLQGIPHDARTFVPKQKTRKLLKQFGSGRSSDGKERQLNEEEIQTLLDRVAAEFTNSAFQRLLQRLTAGNRVVADEEYKLLLRELAKNTPVCAIFQCGQTSEATNELMRVIRGEIDIASAQHSRTVEQMKIWYPGLIECLLPIRKASGRLPEDVCGVVRMMIRIVETQRTMSYFNDPADYEPITGDDPSTGYFPCWPITRGRGKYDVNERSAKDEADTCNKYRHGHKVLGPGIVVYFCPHSITYGFSKDAIRRILLPLCFEEHYLRQCV